MFLFSTIARKLTPGKKKLEKLRERGLVIGRGGARSSTAMSSVPSPISSRSVTTYASRGA